jgi:hypothetical protein
MSKKARYSLILIGFLIFLIATPLIVLYVRGITYDFTTKSFVKTGILTIRSNPSSVNVYLNNRLIRRSEGDINFLTPGQYQITLEKTGYQSWQKRLLISAGDVTWASPGSGDIYLYLLHPAAATVATGVLDFYADDSRLVYLLQNNEIAVSPASNPKSIQKYTLPESVSSIAQSSGNGSFLLESSAASSSPSIVAFNSSSGDSYDLTGMFSDLPEIQFENSGELLALDGGTLYQISLSDKIKTALLENIKTFYYQSGTLYYIQQQQDSLSLYSGQSPFEQNQLLLSGIPEFIQLNLQVTFEKQVFLLADGNLYLAGTDMQELANNVEDWNFDQQNSIISVLHSGELDYYDSFNQSLNFVTRSDNKITYPVIRTGVGDAFFLNDNQLIAIELDSRDSQNQFVLYQGQPQKFSINSNADYVYLLDNGELLKLTVR